jgi:hypothetical protein
MKGLRWLLGCLSATNEGKSTFFLREETWIAPFGVIDDRSSRDPRRSFPL